MKEKLIPTETWHLAEIFKIIQSYPNFFDDTLQINTEADLFKRLDHIVDSLTIKSDGEVIGCMWIDTVFSDFGEFNIIIKRKSINPSATPTLMMQGFRYFFKNLKLKMIFGLIRDTNKASIKLIKKVKGIMITETIKGYEIVNGKSVDCLFTSILKESVT